MRSKTETSTEEIGPNVENSNSVWLAVVAAQLDKGLGFTCDQVESDKEAFLDVLRRFEAGKPVVPAELPDTMWCSNKADNRRKTLPHLFRPNGFLAVSQEVVETLKPFDLGQSEFIPVQFFHTDRKTPFPGQHYFFYIPDRKLGFAPEQSTGFDPRLFDFQEHLGTIRYDIKDDDISTYPLVSEGADVWHDDSLLFSLFFSDRAFSALQNAGLTDDLMAVRCPVIAPI